MSSMAETEKRAGKTAKSAHLAAAKAHRQKADVILAKGGIDHRLLDSLYASKIACDRSTTPKLLEALGRLWLGKSWKTSIAKEANLHRKVAKAHEEAAKS